MKVDCNNYGARMNMVLELITQHILCKTNTMLDENFDHLAGRKNFLKNVIKSRLAHPRTPGSGYG